MRDRSEAPTVPVLDEEEFLSRRAADRAYEGIRARIFDGSLRPGDHLREEQLALLTDTSRTPVREALRRLASEGLVEIGQNRRSYVAEFEEAEADAVFEIRARLESFAAERAATRITDEAILELERISDEIEKLGPQLSVQSLSTFMDLNAEFHRIIVEAAGSRQLAIVLGPAIAIPLVLLKHYIWQGTVDIVQSNQHHRELIQAMKMRNPHWAATAMASHINSRRPVGDFRGKR